MDSMKEENVPQVNPVRRQLLIGAGLAPVFLTLGAAKVNGQGMNVGSPSGAAPFSGVLEGSVDVDNVAGTDATEKKLYELLFTHADKDTLRLYYGGVGSGSVDTGWAVNTTNVGQLNWTAQFERKYADIAEVARGYITALKAKTVEYQAEIDAPNDPKTTIAPLDNEATITAFKNGTTTAPCIAGTNGIMNGISSSEGVWGYTTAVQAALVTAWNAYAAAQTGYNDLP